MARKKRFWRRCFSREPSPPLPLPLPASPPPSLRTLSPAEPMPMPTAVSEKRESKSKSLQTRTKELTVRTRSRRNQQINDGAEEVQDDDSLNEDIESFFADSFDDITLGPNIPVPCFTLPNESTPLLATKREKKKMTDRCTIQ